ncbi:MAG: LysR family transcriptional regulator, partial [Alphaproteobacteria bacterium]|nr:LysR family transcriptional regulator [Alphaproteobacteria bacterium]
EAELEARGLDNEPVGMLRISAPGSFATSVLQPEIRTFLEMYPHVRVDLITDDTYTDLVAEGVDLAFRFGELTDSSLMAKRVMSAYRGIWAAPTYLDKHGTPKAPEDLSEHECLVFRQSMQNQNWTLKHVDSGEERSVRVDGRFRSSSADSLLLAAAQGFGVVIAPDWLVCPYVKAGQLVRIMPQWRGVDLRLSVVWTGGKLRGKSRLFTDHVTTALNDLQAVGS